MRVRWYVSKQTRIIFLTPLSERPERLISKLLCKKKSKLFLYLQPDDASPLVRSDVYAQTEKDGWLPPTPRGIWLQNTPATQAALKLSVKEILQLPITDFVPEWDPSRPRNAPLPLTLAKCLSDDHNKPIIKKKKKKPTTPLQCNELKADLILKKKTEPEEEFPLELTLPCSLEIPSRFLSPLWNLVFSVQLILELCRCFKVSDTIHWFHGLTEENRFVTFMFLRGEIENLCRSLRGVLRTWKRRGRSVPQNQEVHDFVTMIESDLRVLRDEALSTCVEFANPTFSLSELHDLILKSLSLPEKVSLHWTLEQSLEVLFGESSNQLERYDVSWMREQWAKKWRVRMSAADASKECLTWMVLHREIENVPEKMLVTA